MYGGAIRNGKIDYMLAVAVVFGKQISKEKRSVKVRVTERTVAKAVACGSLGPTSFIKDDSHACLARSGSPIGLSGS